MSKLREFYGQLSIRPICAALHQTCKDSGRENPYIEVVFGNNHLTCSVASLQGIDPAWVDRIDFNLQGEKSFQLFVYDSQYRRREDFTGVVDIDLALPIAQRKTINFYNVHKNGQLTGKIKLAIEFIPEGDKECKFDFKNSTIIEGGLLNSEIGKAPNRNFVGSSAF